MRTLLIPGSSPGRPDLSPLAAALVEQGCTLTEQAPADLVFSAPDELDAARVSNPDAVIVLLIPDLSALQTMGELADDALLWPWALPNGAPAEPAALRSRLQILIRWARRTSRALTASRANEQRARSIAAAASEGIIIYDDARILYANERLSRMIGRSSAEMEGRPFSDFASPEEIQRAGERLVNGDRHADLEFTHANGAALPVEVTIREGYWEGKAAHIATIRDLTVQRAREAADMRREARHTAQLAAQLRALEESNTRFRVAARATNDILYDWDVLTGAIVWNDAMRTVLRYTGDLDAAGIQWWATRIHPGDADRVSASLDSAMRAGHEGWTESYRFTALDGTVLDVIDRGVFIRDEAGQCTRMIGAMMDVTGRKQLQTRLVLADRLAGVGTMAAGVAHELNNPLTWVLANIRLVQESVGESLPLPALRALEHAAQGADRMRSIVSDLKVFSRNELHAAEPVDLRATLQSAIRIVASDLRARASLEQTDRTLGSLYVLANEARLAQVLLNLLVNAVQAIDPGQPERNRVLIDVALVTGAPPMRKVAIEIDDTGCGIPPAVRGRIFDPFFTTKPPGEGTGLGLSIGLQLIQEMGGEITHVPRPGRGTRFRVVLPLTDLRPKPSRAGMSLPPTTSTTTQARVLVVDDEEMIVDMLGQILAPEFEVVGEHRSLNALARLRAGERFDTMLCDVMMPDLNGMELYRETLALAPEQARRFIFVSGGVSNPQVHDFLVGTGRLVVEKPFDLHALRATVRKVAGRG